MVYLFHLRNTHRFRDKCKKPIPFQYRTQLKYFINHCGVQWCQPTRNNLITYWHMFVLVMRVAMDTQLLLLCIEISYLGFPRKQFTYFAIKICIPFMYRFNFRIKLLYTPVNKKQEKKSCIFRPVTSDSYDFQWNCNKLKLLRLTSKKYISKF